MDISQLDTDIEKTNEGCKLTAYQDSVGVWTIGYGHTGGGIVPGMTITQECADAFLLSDLKIAFNAVEASVHTPLTVDEESALVDLVFNIGAGNFQHSTLLKLLNAGDYTGTALEFDKWDKAGGQVLAGLCRRRQEETDLFNKGSKNATTS